MPKHLWTIASGTDLPDPTGLPEGYPFAQDNGDGTHTLHGLYGGAWEALGGGGGGGGAVGVGDYAFWQHNAVRDATTATFDYTADLVSSAGTSITPADTDSAWFATWGGQVPLINESGLYEMSFQGQTSALWHPGMDIFDASGSSVAVPGFVSSNWSTTGLDDGTTTFTANLSVTTYIEAGTHFDMSPLGPPAVTITCSLLIKKVG